MDSPLAKPHGADTLPSLASDTASPAIRQYAARRFGRALLTLILLVIAIALCSDPPSHALSWLGGLLRLDAGRSTSGTSVGADLAAALPASLLLVGATLLCILAFGWIGGMLLALDDLHGDGDAQPISGPLRQLHRLGLAGPRIVRVLLAAGQGLPVFWTGGFLVTLCSIWLGWLPAGGIVAPDLPAFGSAAYAAAFRTHPLAIAGDLLAHLALPALALALTAIGGDIRLLGAAIPAEWHAPHTRVARASGLSFPHLLRRTVRASLPSLIVSMAANLPLLAGGVILVEYLFGWPGLGLLAYHAARDGDRTTLQALALLFGAAVIAASTVANLAAAWADPRLRGERQC